MAFVQNKNSQRSQDSSCQNKEIIFQQPHPCLWPCLLQGNWDHKRGNKRSNERANVWGEWERYFNICAELHSIQMFLVKRCIPHCCQLYYKDRTRLLLGIVFYFYLWSKGSACHNVWVITPSAMGCGSGAVDMALWWQGSCWEHIAILLSDVLARGALARLIKVAPEQIISTSNLNTLKSRNNIESCW